MKKRTLFILSIIVVFAFLGYGSTFAKEIKVLSQFPIW
jgi:hypothetical protein